MAIPQGTSATRQTSGQLALRPPELSVPPRRREWLLRQPQNEKALRGGAHRERRRCVDERAAIIVTTNLPFSEWTTVFPNPRLCKALLDRITDRAHIIGTGKESFPFR